MKGFLLRAYDVVNKKKFVNETSVELHISLETEDIDNKDMSENSIYPQVTGYSYDMTIEQHVDKFGTSLSGLTAADIHDTNLHRIGLEWFNAKGGTPAKAEVCWGNFYTESVSYNADNRKVVTSVVKLKGTAELILGNYSTSSSSASSGSAGDASGPDIITDDNVVDTNGES